MGQRGNYIIKSKNKVAYYYTHWRALTIAEDLYLGPKRFLEYVTSCQEDDELMEYAWMEGCVVVDIPQKELYFWSLHFEQNTSVIEHYLVQLSNKWQGWEIKHLKNRMHDIENILTIDYTSKQDLPDFIAAKKIDIINDAVEDWVETVIVIKKTDKIEVRKTQNIYTSNILMYGQDIIELLLEKSRYDLHKEENYRSCSTIVIDVDNRELYVDEYEFGLKESCLSKWPGYNITIGDYGYIGVLKLAGINTEGLLLDQKHVIEHFQGITCPKNDFDPVSFAEEITESNDDVTFNPNFFDTTRPKRTILERIFLAISNIRKL